MSKETCEKVQESTQIVEVVDGNIKVAEDVFKYLYNFQLMKAEAEKVEKNLKDSILKAMEDNNIKSFENDFVKVTYKAPSVRKAVDSARLKEEGLYDLYLKESPVKSSVTVTWK